MDEFNNLKTQLELMMLQLQRSALIDTQTVFQILIDKGVCSADDIVSAKDTIECSNEDVRRLDEQIAKLQGKEYKPKVNKSLLMDQLKQLLSQLNSANDPDHLV